MPSRSWGAVCFADEGRDKLFSMDHRGRIARLLQTMAEGRLDWLLITHLPNIRYLCGFTGSAGVLLIGKRDAVFFTDGRYTEQSGKEVHGVKIKIVQGKSALVATSEWLARRPSFLKLGIEATHLTVADRNALAKRLPRGAKVVDAPAFVEQMRVLKETPEVDRIRQACHLGVELFERLLGVIRPGISEAHAAAQLEFAAREAGAEQMAFPTIIASGPRAALPHHRASLATIPRRGFVMCDFGVILSGYCSDMTRTLHVGRPTAEAHRVYEAVQDAQQAAVEAVRPGATVGEVDSAARKLLHNRGLSKWFTHSTGHGVGLEIHEAPRVASGQNDVLRPGMVITIEPGVYVPGKLGVRIEDTVVVTETGCEILTPYPKNLISI